MPVWKGIVGAGYTTSAFYNYCHELQWTGWRPSFIVLHNTATPSLAQRPNGFAPQHMKGLERYYRDEKGWSAGPHLFVDDKLIWVFTPLPLSGVHSPSWNAVSWGVEMLGDYQKESFSTGRGLKVRRNAVSAMATLSSIVGLRPIHLSFTEKIP